MESKQAKDFEFDDGKVETRLLPRSLTFYIAYTYNK